MRFTQRSLRIPGIRYVSIAPLLFALLLNPGSLLALSELEDYFLFQVDNKKGVRNSDDEVVIPAEYDDLGWSIGEFHPLGEILGYNENGLWGLITLENKKIGSPKYHNLYPLNRQLMVATVQDKALNEELYGVIDVDGNVVLEFEYGWLSMFNNLIVASRKVDNQWKYGLMDLSYQEVLKFKYSHIKTLNNQYALIIEGDKSGLVNASGQVVAPPQYHEIELKGDSFRGKLFDSYEIKNEQNQLLASLQVKYLKSGTKGVFLATGLNSSELLNPDGKLLKSFQNAEVLDFEDNQAIILKNGFYGIIDKTGNQIITPKNKSIWIRDPYIGIQDLSGTWGLFKTDMSLISQRDYQELKPATDGLIPVKRQDRWGFIDSSGEEVIPPQYLEVGDFNEDQAFAKYLGSWGVIDKSGNWLVKPRYDHLEKINQETYLFQSEHQYGIVSTNQQVVYQTTNKLKQEGAGVVEDDGNGRYALISLLGEQALSLRYSNIDAFEENPRYYMFEDEEGFGIFNIEKRSFFRDTTIQEMRTLNEGYIGIKINNQYGLIDLNGKLRIANRYEDIGVFNEDMLPVKIRGRWGYVDRIERLKIQPVYDSVGHFINELAIVSDNNKSGLIDKTGKIILSLKYDQIHRLPEGRFICYQGQKAGLVNIDGKVLIYPTYSSLEILSNGRIKAWKNGKLGLITKEGKTLIPAHYDAFQYDESNKVYLLTKKSPWDIIKL